MKYVCKVSFMYVNTTGVYGCNLIRVWKDDLLEYTGTSDGKRFDFITTKGERISLTREESDCYLEEFKDSELNIESELFDRVSKIEHEIAELRKEIKAILEEYKDQTVL